MCFALLRRAFLRSPQPPPSPRLHLPDPGLSHTHLVEECVSIQSQRGQLSRPPPPCSQVHRREACEHKCVCISISQHAPWHCANTCSFVWEICDACWVMRDTAHSRHHCARPSEGLDRSGDNRAHTPRTFCPLFLFATPFFFFLRPQREKSFRKKSVLCGHHDQSISRLSVRMSIISSPFSITMLPLPPSIYNASNFTLSLSEHALNYFAK